MKELNRWAGHCSVCGEKRERVVITYSSDKFKTSLDVLDFAYKIASDEAVSVGEITAENNWDKDCPHLMLSEYYYSKEDFLAAYDILSLYCAKEHPENLNWVVIYGHLGENEISIYVNVDEKIVRASENDGVDYKSYFESLGY